MLDTRPRRGSNMSRDLQHRAVTTFQRFILNPVAKVFAGVLPGTVLLETKGRRSSKPRRTPVGGRLDGSTLWIVAEFGRKAHYVRNIEADPKVRVRFKGRWRAGTATTAPDDDPRERLRFIKGMNSRTVRLVGTDLLSIRIDLEPR